MTIQKITPIKMFVYATGHSYKSFSLHISSQRNTSPMSLIGSPAKMDSRLKNVIDAEVDFDLDSLIALKKIVDQGIRQLRKNADFPLTIYPPEIDDAA